MLIRLFLLVAIASVLGCQLTMQKKVDAELLTDQNLMHNNMQQLTQVIIHDMFSPPVSSRIYTYSSLAAYEAVRFEKEGNPSFVKSLKGFPEMPEPGKDKKYNFLLAATKAFFTVAAKITFSADTLDNYQEKVFNDFKTLLEPEIYQRSMDFGALVGEKILERTKVDNYKQTRGMPKFLGSDEPGKWRPTPPDYLDAAEPYWSLILPLAIDSSSLFKCPFPQKYSADKKSSFYKNLNEVYSISTNLTDSQSLIAKYWDDNPFVIEHSGHLMYANKKITPVGHWIGITGIACKIKNADAVTTAQAYAATSVAMFDVIVACWKEKFSSQVVRPVTAINELIDRDWQPFLQTPPFPEHSSGHSGISAAAATVLTYKFGENFAFEDTSDLAYIGMKRNFTSFNQAAMEASLSRVYGGIHYRSGIDAGAVQGRYIGRYVVEKLLVGK